MEILNLWKQEILGFAREEKVERFWRFFLLYPHSALAHILHKKLNTRRHQPTVYISLCTTQNYELNSALSHVMPTRRRQTKVYISSWTALGKESSISSKPTRKMSVDFMFWLKKETWNTQEGLNMTCHGQVFLWQFLYVL